MNQENTFSYKYSAKENQEIEEIRKKYLPQSKKDELDMSIIIKKEGTTMNKNDQEFLVQKIHTQYTEKEHTQLDALKELDAKVKHPANVFAYIFGSIGAIIMGSGMSLVMTDIGSIIGVAETTISGIVIGIVGMLMVIFNYPIYKHLLASRRKQYAEQIIELSEKIMNHK